MVAATVPSARAWTIMESVMQAHVKNVLTVPVDLNATLQIVKHV